MIATLGLLPDHNLKTPSEMLELSVTEEGNTTSAASTVIDVDVMQSELGKLGCLMEGILKDVYAPQQCGIRLVEVHMQKLESWLRGIPG